MTPAPVEVLVVDDTLGNLMALEAVLGPPDITVVRAASGAEALALVQANDYAVMILDVQMPHMDGFEVARRVREQAIRPSTPIIFLTAFDPDPPQVRRAYASGAVDFVVKPFDPEILRSKVLVFVELFRKSREAALGARIERERDEANAREIELKRMDRLKDEFLATLAHELRNPLTALLGAAELLAKQAVEDPALARLHRLVGRQVAHLRRLVEDSLEISRFTQGKIEVRAEEIDLRDAIERGVELSQGAIESNRIELAVRLPPEPVRITGDPVRLAQVVSNLLDNAAKFTPRGGQVWLTLEASQEVAGTGAIVRVRDSGRGIPPDLLARIFEPFVQAEAGDAARAGLGIGLALVKQLVQLHGGRVRATSAGSEKGAELIVTLPLAAPAHPAGAETAGSSSSRPVSQGAPRRARVLIVDDNPEIRTTLQVFLQIEGHSVLTADCGRAALDQVAGADPDVVLLDIGLPDLDGYAVARQVRATRDDGRPRLIAMTGNAGTHERERALRAGFDAHLPKPIDGRTLLGAVADARSR